MVIGDFDLVGMAFLPSNSDPVLLIDANTVLIRSITLEAFRTRLPGGTVSFMTSLTRLI